MPEITLLPRLSTLIALMVLVAWIDWRRHGDHATRWREYSFLLAAGFTGGLVGAVNDQITATISSDYFVLGKGIAPGPAFRCEVARLGFHAGLFAGLVAGGSYLLVNNPRNDRPALPYRRLVRLAAWPLVGASLAAPLLAVLFVTSAPHCLTSRLDGFVNQELHGRFLAVWGIHAGLYFGGIAGTFWGVSRIFVGRRRSRLSCPKHTHD